MGTRHAKAIACVFLLLALSTLVRFDVFVPLYRHAPGPHVTGSAAPRVADSPLPCSGMPMRARRDSVHTTIRRRPARTGGHVGAVDARSRRPRMPCQTDPAVPPSWLFREAGPADGTGCRDPEDDALVSGAGAAAGQPPPPAWTPELWSVRETHHCSTLGARTTSAPMALKDI